MPDAHVVTWIREKHSAIQADLNEQARRRCDAAEARSIGWGGISAMELATGLSDSLIRTYVVAGPTFTVRLLVRVGSKSLACASCYLPFAICYHALGSAINS